MKSSDIDLFIIAPHSKEPSYRHARQIHRCLRGIGTPVDVIVQIHDEVERSKNVAASLATVVLKKARCFMNEAKIHDIQQWLICVGTGSIRC
ncbi:MAG: hypothetical protein HZB80_01135 [Deltaproteobacteria bacterium]|nr:hypothetical protein [Deltaproteobacteria bacterium]